MKNTKKRGFTIVELVIVIAVIAILAAVLIPTFSNVIEKANQSNALSSAKNAWTCYQAENAQTFSKVNGYVQFTNGTDATTDDVWFKIKDGQFQTTVVAAPNDTTGYDEVKYVAASESDAEKAAYLKGTNCVIYILTSNNG